MKTFIFAILLTCVSASTAMGQSFASKLYCHVFGNDDLSLEYRELVYQALADYGITDPQSVPVKKMNHVGSALAGMPLSSFTACGIWFDEEYLDSCSGYDLVFQIYHEAAHYAYCHHQKLVATELALTGGIAAGLAYLYSQLKKHENPYACAVTLGAGVVSGLALIVGITPYLVKQQEKEADIKACECLIDVDCREIIVQRIRDLQASQADGNTWWFPEAEQVNYLEDVLHSAAR